MNALPETDVVIVGGGIIGLCIAYEAAGRGMNVTVCAASIRGATYAAAGMIAPVTEATYGEDDLLRFNLLGATRYPQFLADLSIASGVELHLSASPTLVLARDRDQVEAMRRLWDFQQELGLDTSWLTSEEVRHLEPALHPSVRGGVLAAEDRSIDPLAVHAALTTALERLGVAMIDSQAIAITPEPDGTVTVDTAAGPLNARQMVLAAGCWSSGIEGAPAEIVSAMRPVKGQILRLRPRSPSTDTPAHILRTEDVYLVPRNDSEIVVGATMEEQGFDTTVTAGGVFELLRAADEIFPAVREMELHSCIASLRPGTRDNAPLIGPTSVPGVIAATGHFRNGILLAPVTAQAVGILLADGVVVDEIKAFDPMRFS